MHMPNSYEDAQRSVSNYIMQTDMMTRPASDMGEFRGISSAVQPPFHGSIDTESSLHGVGRVNSRYEPGEIAVEKVAVVPAAQLNGDAYVASLESQSTRTKRPENVLSGVSIDRFQYLHENPQDVSTIVFDELQRGGTHSRLCTKDATVKSNGHVMKLKPSYGAKC